MRSSILILLLSFCVALAACNASGPSRDVPSRTRGKTAQPFGGSAAPPSEKSEPSRGDFRVVFFQALGSRSFILVNQGHSLRKSQKGRERLAILPGQGYKVLSEQGMGALRESLGQWGLNRLSTAFQRGDQRYFQPDQVGDRYRGMVFVEENGVRRKVLGFRAADSTDSLGQERFSAFVQLKLVCLNWFKDTSQTEVPGSGVIMRSGDR